MPWKPKPHLQKPRRREHHTKSTSERGYGWDWQQASKRYLIEHPLCEDCLDEDRVTPAVEVHHVAKIKHAPEKRLDPENMRALCEPHHDKRTARGE